ncbi:MAG TPA: hypothetical protein VIR98_03445 [Candidatus Paceibacterota bacterium]
METNLEKKIDWAHLNKRLITFCALALLFVGSLSYLVSVAFKSRDSMQQSKQNRDIEIYLDDLNQTASPSASATAE